MTVGKLVATADGNRPKDIRRRVLIKNQNVYRAELQGAKK